MTFADGWTCRACWKGNRAQDAVCYRCKTPRGADDAAVEAQRAAKAAAEEKPEAVPDIVVALPVVIFRTYARAWLRGGLLVLGLLILIALGGVTDTGYLLLTGGMGAGLVVIGFLAGEVSDAMRDREPWAYIVGVGLAIGGAIGSIYAFNVLAPDIVSPTAIRWLSVIIFGGAGLAALAGAVLILMRRE
jgi:hypothetical protein